MQSFLQEVTSHILTNYPDTTGDLCVVTPNRRAGLFLREHFAAELTKAVWAPEILSIEDFINRITGYTVIDNLGLLFEFYGIYKKLEKEHAESIDAFMSWGPALLRDFDEVDSALADPAKLYTYLQDIRYIDTWNPDGSPLTDFQKSYLAFTGKMHTYHRELAKHLAEKKMAWQGLSSRHAANKVLEDTTGLPWQKIIFAGFNALTEAEETIIHALLRENMADYLTDADPYFTDDSEHEAGRFIRKYKHIFPRFQQYPLKGLYKNNTKNIRLLGIAKNVNQARLAGNLLREKTILTSDEQTAVVLADENLLIPVLNSLPGDAGHINVTMGYPLSRTNMFAFYETLFQLHLRANAGEETGTQAYYHKDLNDLFSHAAAGLLHDPEKGQELNNTLLQEIKASNSGFLSFSDLESMTKEPESFRKSFGFLSDDWLKRPDNVFPVLLGLTHSLDRLFREKAARQGGDIVQTPYFADFESLYYFAKIFRRMEAFLQEFPFLSSLKTLHRLFKQATSEARLSFSGEPLQGLQVMGMLETRSLDFRNVILLSTNEGVLPRPGNAHSFIPYEVKKSFGLRLHHDQDAIYAYHFYRLLQRAENVFLIYNTQSGDIGSNEKSRFLTQLSYELPGYNPTTNIREDIVSLPPPDGGNNNRVIRIEKSTDILETISAMAYGRGFSPSALGRYINCPLQFYFEKIARLEESEEVEETIEARTMGNVVHGVMEDLFKPFVGQVMKPEMIGDMEKLLKDFLQKRFSEEYKGGNIRRGRNLLLYHLCLRYLENMLLAEKAFLHEAAGENRHISLLALEEPLRAGLDVFSHDRSTEEVILAGKADRIDRNGQLLRIIDYKTARIYSKDLSLADWQDAISNSDKTKGFQLLCYAWLYWQNHRDTTWIEPGIISVRNPGKGSQVMKYPGGKGALNGDHLMEFEESLRALISQIMDASIPFTQTDKEDNCTHCLFRRVCSR